MKFLCLGYLKPTVMDARPKEEIEAVMRECHPHLEHMYKSDRVLIDTGVSPESKCLFRSNGKVEVTDDPMIETGETIGSMFLIEARDMEEAVSIASLHPTVQIEAGEQYGWRVEIRPVHYFWDKDR